MGDSAASFLNALYAQRPIYGKPWHFYYGPLAILAFLLLAMLGMFGISALAWNEIQSNQGISFLIWPQLPQLLLQAGILLIWLVVMLLLGGLFLSTLRRLSLLRWLGINPQPWLTIDRNGIRYEGKLIPWSNIKAFTPYTTKIRSYISYDISVQQINGASIVITSPADLTKYLLPDERPPLPLRGTESAQFTLWALLYYCWQFNNFYDRQGKLKETEHKCRSSEVA